MSSFKKQQQEKNNNEVIQDTVKQLQANTEDITNAGASFRENCPEILQPIKNLKFCGMRDQKNPKFFIENFEHFMDQEGLDEEEKQNYFIDSLRMYAAIWMEERGYGTYEEMKEAFLSFYWNSDIQNSFQKYLDIGRYNRNKCRLSMTNYFLKYAIGARFLDTAPSDKEIIQKLLKHFDPMVENEILIQQANTIDEVANILKRIDILKGNIPDSGFNKSNIKLLLTLENEQNGFKKDKDFKMWALLYFLLACVTIVLYIITKIYLKN